MKLPLVLTLALMPTAACLPPEADPCAGVTCATGRRCLQGRCVELDGGSAAGSEAGRDLNRPDDAHTDQMPVESGPDGAPCAPASKEVRVKAYVDGLSRLHFQDNQVWWHHVALAAPGYFNAPPVKPTYVNQQQWLPTWPFTNDGNNCNCVSDKLDLCSVGCSLGSQPTLTGVQTVASRGEIKVVELPSAQNGYLTVVAILDLPGLADWHEIVVIFQ